jgi:hypothetical protein
MTACSSPQRMRVAQAVPGRPGVGVIWRPRVVDGDPDEGRQHAGGVHRLPAPPGVHGDQGILAGRGRVDPGQLPGDPEPVSSKCATSAAAAAARIASSGLPSAEAIRVTMAATAPGETGTPNSSAIAWQVRSRDRNCPCHRYAHAPPIRGPYCTGAVTPAGAVPAVTVPHEQRRDTIRCSVTSPRICSGRSVTCRRSVLVTGAPVRPVPQPPHAPGSCTTTSSGSSVIARVAPGCPFGRPGLRPDLPRSDLGAGLARPSDDGGFEEFRGFWPSGSGHRPAVPVVFV